MNFNVDSAKINRAREILLVHGQLALVRALDNALGATKEGEMAIRTHFDVGAVVNECILQARSYCPEEFLPSPQPAADTLVVARQPAEAEYTQGLRGNPFVDDRQDSLPALEVRRAARYAPDNDTSSN